MAVNFKDYYQILGISKSASADDVRKAFRKLARKYHPDVAEDKKTAEEKFKEINEAYEVLSDPDKRSKYDAYGADWEHAGQRGGGFRGGGAPGGFGAGGSYGGADADGVHFEFGGTGYSDFFEQMFGARRGRARGAGAFGFEEMPQRGQDIEADIMVTLEEVIDGSTRQISFRRSDQAAPGTYTVKIPKGVREGQRIRLTGVGGQGASGGQAGDLYLRVKLQRHPFFEVDGSDVLHDLEIPVHRAVLGCEVEVPTLEGRARLKIPPGTQSGKKFRMGGKGLPKPGGGRGDFYVVVDPQLPETLGTEEKEIWEKLAKLHES